MKIVLYNMCKQDAQQIALQQWYAPSPIYSLEGFRHMTEERMAQSEGSSGHWQGSSWQGIFHPCYAFPQGKIVHYLAWEKGRRVRLVEGAPPGLAVLP